MDNLETKETQKIFSFPLIYRAYLDCRRHKRYTYHAAKFELHLESEILKLERELNNKTYKISRSICFVVTCPTLREVFAATFRDRVVHHLLYNALNPIFEPTFIHQSFACRKNKGIHNSLKYLKVCIRRLSQNGLRPGYYLHLDIKGFFMSLNKNILYQLISEKIQHPDLLWLSKLIVDADPTTDFTSKSPKELFHQVPPHKSLFHIPKDQGLPIGNLTSQFFANVYLNELDQFAKHTLKAKYYLRYVDDFIFLAENKEQLLEWRDQIEVFLKNNLKISLNSKKQILQLVTKGIDWLGYVVYPDRVLVRPRVIKSFKRKLFLINQDLRKSSLGTKDKNPHQLSFGISDPPLETIEKILAIVNSYFGFFRHANSYKLRSKLWKKHFGDIKNYLEPKKIDSLVSWHDLVSFQIRPDFVKKCQDRKNQADPFFQPDSCH